MEIFFAGGDKMLDNRVLFWEIDETVDPPVYRAVTVGELKDRLRPYGAPSREDTLAELERARHLRDMEVPHYEADQALVRHINDREITEAYGRITPKYYA